MDSSKTDEKEKLNEINLMMQCNKEKFEMIQSESDLVNKKSYMKDISIFDTKLKIILGLSSTLY